MDLEEWEILSDGGFVDQQDQGGNKMKNTTLIDMDYFENISDQQKKNNNLMVIPVPIKLDDQEEEEEIPEEVTKLPILESSNDSKDENFDDQEMIPKVFFKKLEENQFVDMKMDVGTYEFVKKGEKDSNFEMKNTENDEKLVVYEEKKVKMEEEDEEEEEEEHGGVKIWKWAMTGMGALVSFGFAAATVSLIAFSNKHQDGKNSKNQDLHFQMLSHDKRFKQVVRRAKRLNEAISVMRGAPMTRATITIGGYYEAL